MKNLRVKSWLRCGAIKSTMLLLEEFLRQKVEMLLKNYYYWQQDVLPVRCIDDIFDLAKEYKMRDATTMGYKKSKGALKKQKKTRRRRGSEK